MYCHVYQVGSDWLPDLFTMEIITTHGYNYNENILALALVASWIPLAELHCADVLTSWVEHF
jgi:hypothetical protein